MESYGTTEARDISISRVRWIKLKHTPVPCWVYRDGVLSLSPAALAVYIVLLHQQRIMPSWKRETAIRFNEVITVKVAQTDMVNKTGYSRNAVGAALKELQSEGLINETRTRKKAGEFGYSEYQFLNPEEGEPMRLQDDYRSLIVSNHIHYFQFPSCLVTEIGARWSLANLSGSELKLYTGILRLVGLNLGKQFNIERVKLRRSAGIKQNGTFENALDDLELERGLLSKGKRPVTTVCSDV